MKVAVKGLSSKDAVMMWLRPADMSTAFKSVLKKVLETDYVSLFLAENDIDVVS